MTRFKQGDIVVNKYFVNLIFLVARLDPSNYDLLPMTDAARHRFPEGFLIDFRIADGEYELGA